MNKRKKRNYQNNMPNRSKLQITSKFAILMIGVLIVLQIVTAIQTSASSAVLSSLEQKEIELIRENQEIASTVVDTNSLIVIKERSGELGYSTPEATYFITEQDTVALLR